MRFDPQKACPEAYTVMLQLENFVRQNLDHQLYELIKIRASQINGCAFCINMHTRDARKLGETEQRIYLLNAWREAPFYTEKERAALALTEAVTRIHEDGVPEEVYQEVRKHFDETEYVILIMAINAINAWNRIAISTEKPSPITDHRAGRTFRPRNRFRCTWKTESLSSGFIPCEKTRTFADRLANSRQNCYDAVGIIN